MRHAAIPARALATAFALAASCALAAALAPAAGRAQPAPPAAASAAPAPPAAPAPSAAASVPAPSPAYRPIDSTRAVLATPLFPGWGQLYADNGWRAVLAFGAQTYYWSQLLKCDRKAVRLQRTTARLPEASSLRTLYGLQTHEYREQVRDYAWWSLGALLIIALDAYVGAQLHDFDRDSVPVPDRWDAADAARAAGAAEAAAESPPPAIEGTVLLAWRAAF